MGDSLSEAPGWSGWGTVCGKQQHSQQMKNRPGNWLVAVQLEGDLLLAKVPSQSRRRCSKCKGREGTQLLMQGWTATAKSRSFISAL